MQSLHLPALHLIFFLSGLAGLGCQLAWTRMLTVGLGHEMPSVLAVVAAFFGGLTVGAWMFAGGVARTKKPGQLYARLEALIGVWALATIALIPQVNHITLSLIGTDPSPARHWFVAFFYPFLVLMPATTAMGATLPAMQRFIARMTGPRRSIGALYAANTAGAIVGVALATFVLGPALGHSTSLAVFAGINLICAAGAAFLVRSPVPMAPSPAQSSEAVGGASDPALPAAMLLPLLFLTGLLGIGYEALAVRALSQILEGTIFSYAAALMVFLTGTAIGSAIYQRFGNRAAFAPLLAWLLASIALSCFIGIWQLDKAGDLHLLHRQTVEPTLAGRFRAELAIAAGVLFLPALFMGATFSHLVEAAGRTGRTVGRAVAINTLGAALAPLLFVVVLVPIESVGIVNALLTVAAGYALLTALPLLRSPRVHLLAPLLALAMLYPASRTSLAPAQQAEEVVATGPNIAQRERAISYREGVMASVAVLESESGRVLQVNGRFNMGSTAKEAVVLQRCQGHIPLLLHPSPRTVLHLGSATGITLGAATVHKDVTVTGVELLPEVIDAMRYFEPENGGPFDPKSAKLQVADARRFIRATGERYDVIIADLFHPAADGAGFLYTVEHFQAVRARLNDGGLFCQWLPLYQLDEQTLKIITRSFMEVFPEARAFMADFNTDLPVLGLIGEKTPRRYPLPWYGQRFAGDRQALATITSQQLRLEDDLRLFGRWVATYPTLRRIADDAPLNTDDHPHVLYGAPRTKPVGGAGGKLLARLLAENDDLVTELNGQVTKESAEYLLRLIQFIRARNVFLEGRQLAADGKHAAALDRYIESARLSADFTYGYAFAVSMALGSMRDSPVQTRTTLERLDAAQPSISAARDWLKRLFPEQ